MLEKTATEHTFFSRNGNITYILGIGQQADVIKTKLYRCYRIGTFGNARKNQILPFHRQSQRPQFTFVVKMM